MIVTTCFFDVLLDCSAADVGRAIAERLDHGDKSAPIDCAPGARFDWFVDGRAVTLEVVERHDYLQLLIDGHLHGAELWEMCCNTKAAGALSCRVIE